MKFSAALRQTRVQPIPACCCALACAAVVAMPVPARADGDAVAARAAEAVAATSRAAPAVTREVDTIRTRLPNDGALPLTADGRPMSQLAGVNYRLWVGRGSTQLGFGVGTLGYVQPAPDARAESASSLVGSSPTLSLGVRHRVDAASMIYANAVGTRSLGGDLNAGYVDTKVGVEWKPARRTFGFEQGAFGFHLDSGYRLALKAHHGGVGLYLRGQF